jgi:hypothetical protein
MRGLRPGNPWRTSPQLRQLQLAWGKPPPAADPSTLMITTAYRCISGVRLGSGLDINANLLNLHGHRTANATAVGSFDRRNSK